MLGEGEERAAEGAVLKEEDGMRDRDAVWQQLAQLGLRPAVDDERGHQVQVGTRVDTVGDAGRDDGEDGRGPLTAEVFPGEEPVAPPQNKLSQLAFDPIVRELDVAIAEKEHQTLQLAVQVAERGPEGGLGWHRRARLFEPDSEAFHHGHAVLRASGEPLRGVVAVERALSFHEEEWPDQAQRREADLVAGASGFDKPAARVTPASRAQSAGALDERRDVGAVALDVPADILAEKTADTGGVTLCRVDEAHPTRVGPAPDRALPDAIGGVAVKHRDAGRVGGQQAGRPRLLLDHPGDRRQQIDRRADAAPERLGSDVDAGTRPAQGLPLDRLVLEKLVGQRLDDEGGAELAPLDQLGRRRGRYDRVVVRARHPLSQSLAHEKLGRPYVEDLAYRVGDCLHLLAAQRAGSQVRRDRVDLGDALEVFGQGRAPRMTGPFLLRLLVRTRAPAGPVLVVRRRGRLVDYRDQDPEGEQQLALDAAELLRLRSPAPHVHQAPCQLRVDVAHPRDERNDRDHELDEPQRLDHLLQPLPDVIDVGHVGRSDRRWLAHPAESSVARRKRPEHDGCASESDWLTWSSG